MLINLELEIINSPNYCINYLKKLIDNYFIKFIINFDNLYFDQLIGVNKYILKIDNFNNFPINELLNKIESHIKNIYPDCGNSWKLKSNYYKVFI